MIKPRYIQCIDDLIKKYNFKLGAELGVKTGRSSISLLHNNPDLHMIAVDLWDTHESIIETQHDHELDYKTCLKNIKEFKVDDRITIIRKLITQASKDIEDNSLDFIFVDGTHTPEQLILDLKAWIPKVKPTGAICGHDYVSRFGMKPVINSLGVRERGYIDKSWGCSWWILYKDYNKNWEELC